MDYFFEHLLSEFKLPLHNPVLVFSLMLFIILLSPIVLRKARIPAIIGLILSGVLIGPKGLNLIGSEAMAASGNMLRECQDQFYNVGFLRCVPHTTQQL